MNRRDALTNLGFVAGSALGAFGMRDEITRAQTPAQAATFPRKADFNIADGYTYISGAYTHPMPIAAAEAYHQVVTRRSTLAPASGPTGTGVSGPQRSIPVRPDAKAAFATLINAKPSEVCYVPNTSTGENLVVEGLGIRKFDGNVVTDELHFEGALVHLQQLKKEGLDLRIVTRRPDGRIDMKDMERVVDNKTRLIEVSLVSMYNGFQHDLKAVCDLAHAHGAYVYADIIQGAGAVPIDVRASNLDFAACATYKWLMGDFGLGFFYVREDLLERVIKRPHWSYESAPDAAIHLSPFDPRHPTPITWTAGSGATTYFQLGTMASAVAAALGVSIPYIQSLGVENIQRHRQPLLKRLQQEMPRLGFTPQTPEDSTSPIVTFAIKDTAAVTRKLNAARVNVRVADYWVRIAPSVYNDMHDVERLLEALA